MPYLTLQGSARIGVWMSFVAWLLFLGLLTQFFQVVMSKERRPNKQLNSRVYPDGTREISLKADRAHHYWVSGKINGVPAEFLIDTGASYVSVPEHLGTQLGLETKGYRLAETANGSVEVGETKITLLEIGPIVLRDVKGTLNPGLKSSQILLGMSALKRLEFVQKKDVLVLKQL